MAEQQGERDRRCPVCGRSNTYFVTKAESFWTRGLMLDYFRCRGCGSLFCGVQSALVYHEEQLVDEKFYVEFEAGIPFLSHLAVNLKGLCEGKGEVRFLDVGCGLGFTLDMARFLGWKAIGVEPSPIGQVGRGLLGIEVVSAYLEETDFAESSFDVILTSEVIEHVPQPQDFLRVLRKYLKPDGILCLTTPNADAYAIESEGVSLEIISPGAHLCVLSPKAMGLLLERAGFEHCRIEFSEGTSGRSRMIVFASPKRSLRDLKYVRVPDDGCVEFQRRYLHHVVDSRWEGGKDYVYDGALFRLLESYTNGGEMEVASQLCRLLEDSIRQKYGELNKGFFASLLEKARSGNIRDYREYVAKIPSFLSRYFYYKGMIYLNYTRDFAVAEECFSRAYDLFACEQSIFRFYANWDMAPRARYHVALAKLYAGRQREALTDLGQMLGDRYDLPKDLLPQLYFSRGVAYLQVGDNMAALGSFARALKESFVWSLRARLLDRGLFRQVVRLAMLALRQHFHALTGK